MLSYFKSIVYSLAKTITGGGTKLSTRQKYHQDRQVAEQAVLDRASHGEKLFRKNFCPACGTSNEVSFSNPIGFSFARCACNMVYMDPVPTDETLSLLYNDSSMAMPFTAIRKAARPENVEEHQFLLKHVPKSGKLLDVGCAAGGYLATAQQDFEVSGIEISQETTDVAREAGFDVMCGTLTDIPSELRFDVITMWQVIEHLPDPRPDFERIHSLLREGGYFVFATPNIDSASFEYLGSKHIHVSSFGHVSLFSRESLEAIAKQCNFEMIAHEHYGGLDIKAHDLISYSISKKKFRHRHSLYNGEIVAFGKRH